MTATAQTAMVLLLLAATVPAGAAGVSIETTIDADSVTVGERFTVSFELAWPDSLRMLPPEAVDLGESRVVSEHWGEERAADGDAATTTRRGAMTAITLSLDGASIPAIPFAFVTPGGDTVREHSRALDVPVRLIAPDTVSMAGMRPLKDPWEAPRGMLAWALAAIGAVLAAALVWWLWRRRRARPEAVRPEPVLPPDHVALTELTRIERMGLLERGEFKAYYTLVVDALRHYLGARYGIEAMDRTTGEVLDDLAADPRDIPVGALEALMREADLVKFARHAPVVENGTAAMRAAREFIARTAPRLAEDAGVDATVKEGVG